MILFQDKKKKMKRAFFQHVHLKKMMCSIRVVGLFHAHKITNAHNRGSGWCSGCSLRLAPMGPGFNSRYGLYVQMVSQSMFALAGFLRDLRFPPAFKIGTLYCMLC